MDFSGLSVVLGVGTGRMLALLREQVENSAGTLLVVAYRQGDLQRLRSQGGWQGPGALLARGRPQRIPVLSDTVDLLVVNGVLRQVPAEQMDAMFDELWRALVPGGRLRVSDLIEPPEAPHSRAWAERNRIVRKLGSVISLPTALSVDVRRVAVAVQSAGFERLHISILPGYGLTDAWLEETVNSLRTMCSRVADRTVRDAILDEDIPQLIAAYARGAQRAAERFVLQGAKVGDLALDMEASFTEDDLAPLD